MTPTPERLFPIYRVSVEWVQNGVDGGAPPDSWRVRDLPAGRVRNRTSYDVMREVRDDATEDTKTLEWFTTYRVKKEDGGEWSDVQLKTEFLGEESWCLGWFGHWRIDVGESDAEVLDSFQRFVDRKQRINAEAYDKWKPADGYFVAPYCLMGAEDRYRWTARGERTSITGTGPRTNDPPCRCDGCKAAGIVRIDH